MKRTLVVTVIVGGLLFAFFTMRIGSQRQMMAMDEAREAQQRARTLVDPPSPMSPPGEQSGALTAIEPPQSGRASLADNEDNVPVVSDSRSKDTGTVETVDDSKNELKVFRLQNANAAEAIETIRPLLPRQAKVSEDERTNSLILSADADSMAVLEAVLLKLDENPTPSKARQAPLADPKELPARRLPMPSGVRLSGPPHLSVVPKDDQDAAMDRDAKQLAARVRAAKEPEKSKLRAELEMLTEKHFDLRQQRREAEIAELAHRVDELRVAHHRRQENKPDILKHRLADLLDEENELKWDDARLKPAIPATQAPPKPVERTSLLDFGVDPVPNPETESSRIAVIRAAHRKAAEARLRLAKLELERVIEINRKVPGSVSSSEVEKLATNVTIAEVERELAGAGADPRGVKPHGTPLSEPVAAAKLQKAEIVLKSARTEFNRTQKLVASKSVSTAEVDRATALVEEAQADVEIAKAELEEARRVTQPTPGR